MVVKTLHATVTVREARARFSEILDAVSQGEEFVVTSHGEPKAKIIAPPASTAPLSIDLKWLKSMPVSRPHVTSDVLIRHDRDTRD